MKLLNCPNYPGMRHKALWLGTTMVIFADALNQQIVCVQSNIIDALSLRAHLLGRIVGID